MIEANLKVAGCSFRPNVCNDFMLEYGNGEIGPGVALVPEPDNEHDPHAVQVIDTESRVLGYLPTGAASLFCALLEYGPTISAEVFKVVPGKKYPQIFITIGIEE